MGIAAQLFYTSNSDRQTLHRRIVPSEKQREEQQDRWNDLAEYLKEDLKDTSGLPVHSWLQGSYKFGTQLRPLAVGEEFDIDLGIYFDWPGDAEDSKYDPIDLKNMLHASLLLYADNEQEVVEVAEPKTRCSRIHYSGHFHIDIPAYHIDSARDHRDLATQDNEWENSDPKAIYIWFRDKFHSDVRFRVRRLIGYMKAWSILNLRKGEGRPSSLLLTVLVAQEYSKVSTRAASADDEALHSIINLIRTRVARNRNVRNPVDETEMLSECLDDDKFNTFMSALEDVANIAERAIGAKAEVVAADIWSQAFGHFFPLPEAPATIAQPPEKEYLPVPAIVPRVFINAKRQKAVFRKKNEWNGIDRIGPIPKKCDITFEVINKDNIPVNATVEWMVRNEGVEAEDVNDLGHKAGFGYKARERSAYKGRHYMDCVVKRYGHVIGVKRIPVDIY